MSGTAASPVPIRPKPAHGTGNTVPHTNPPGSLVRKPRGGPVIFVNASDLNAEGEAKDNKRTVKRWAMLNRHNSHVNSRATPAKAKFLSWDSSVPTTQDSKEVEIGQKTAKSRALPSPTLQQGQRIIPLVDPMHDAALSHPERKLPFFADDAVRKMLDFYKNVGDAHPDPANRGHRMRLCNTAIYPMLVESRAAFCSLIATFESDPGFPLKSNRKGLRDYFLGSALAETYTLITKSNSKPSADAFLSVALLMWISFHMEDSKALSIHFTGMAALVTHHWDVFASRPFFRGGAFFWENRENEGNLLPDIPWPSSNSIEASSPFQDLASKDFISLEASGIAPKGLADLLNIMLRLEPYIKCGKNNTLTVPVAKDFLRYLLLIARSFAALSDACQTSLQNCLRQACIIHFYSSIYRNSKTGVGWIAMPMKTELEASDLDNLIENFPSLLLWLVLTVGPFAVGHVREWYAELLVRSIRVKPVDSFETAAVECEHKFLWTRELDYNAKEFWTEALLFRKAL